MSFQQKLIKWFEKNQRPLPWRRRYEPYEVWISEIMLQQTQVATMLPYFRRWMKAFPTIRALAQSNEKKALKTWQGLGYYSRARNLHASARAIVKHHDGVFPHGDESIGALKGVGRYTAGAIASIAFNRERPIVDGNVLRVLSRIYAIKKPIDVPQNREFFWKLQASLIPKGRARLFNQALMELGALVCTAKNPSCGSCPVQTHCVASLEDRAGAYPVRVKKKKIVKVLAGAMVIARDGKFLIRRRPTGRIMGGLWEFPEWKLGVRPPSAGRIRPRYARRTLIDSLKKTQKLAEREFGIKLKRLTHWGSLKRNYTHHNESLEIFSAEIPDSANVSQREKWPARWITKGDFEKFPFSSAHAKIAEKIKTRLF